MQPGKRRYEIQLQSKSGPIDVFLIQDIKYASISSQQSAAAAADMASEHDLLLKHFDLTSDQYVFDNAAEKGAGDMSFNDVFANVFSM